MEPADENIKPDVAESDEDAANDLQPETGPGSANDGVGTESTPGVSGRS
jgi:hypothetical protein